MLIIAVSIKSVSAYKSVIVRDKIFIIHLKTLFCLRMYEAVHYYSAHRHAKCVPAYHLSQRARQWRRESRQMQAAEIFVAIIYV